MELATKILLINWIVLFCVSAFDRHCLDDWLEYSKYTRPFVVLWVLASIVAVPGWTIWAIWIN